MFRIKSKYLLNFKTQNPFLSKIKIRLSLRKYTDEKQFNFSESYKQPQLSEQNELMIEKLVDTFKRNKNPFIQKTNQFTIKFCPTCPPHKNSPDNLYKLTVWKNGGFYCQRCNNKGPNLKLLDLLNKTEPNMQPNVQYTQNTPEYNNEHSMEPGASFNERASYPSPTEIHERALEESKGDHKMDLEQLSEKRGLDIETFDKFKVGITTWKFFDKMANGVVEKGTVVYPWYAFHKDGTRLQRVKLRSLSEKSNQYLYPKNGFWGLFGLNLIESEDKEVVLTEGEYDAMAVTQATGMKAVSLPNGCNFLPKDVLPSFNQFEKIYLWLDNDEIGQKRVYEFCKILGFGRCKIVITQPDEEGKIAKDANEVLLAKKDMKSIIESASSCSHDHIKSFNDIRKDIFWEIKNNDNERGVKLMTMPCFNKFTKGHRKGEMTILTGRTGIGKTTFLSQISLDLACQGVKTLWGSFEVKTSRLGKTMMKQYYGTNIEKCVGEFNEKFAEISALPISFTSFFGTTEIDKLLETIEFSAEVQKIEHLLIDNLQFMLGHSSKGNRFDYMDSVNNQFFESWAVSKFRDIATRKNIHITLVIHPRKEDDSNPIGVSSIFGSAKASQEADNIIVIENAEDQKTLHIKKNRFSGGMGYVNYNFDKESQLFYTKDSLIENDKPVGIKDLYQRKKETLGSRTETKQDTESDLFKIHKVD